MRAALRPSSRFPLRLPLRLLLASVLCLQLAGAPARAASGVVIDATSGRPIAGATVTAGVHTTLSDTAGRFTLAAPAGHVAARAPGHGRADLTADPGQTQELRIALAPFAPKALYLSFYGIGSGALRDAALRLAEQTEINALVIDVKGDRGLIPYASQVALATEVGAQKIRTVKDMPAVIAALHRQGLYLIARVVVFKDDLLAAARPELAVTDDHGKRWHDGENLGWVDPSRRAVWDYNLDIAEEAARLGFDEIQFDYLRFPDAPGLRYGVPNTRAERVAAIEGFLGAARARLTPYNVFVAADIFGYVMWNLDDTAIGQQLESLAALLDYVCPMLYPSGFKWGIPNSRNPVEHPYQIVYQSLMRGRARTGLAGARFRPWLQDFSDYAFDRRKFGAPELKAQIDAAEAADANGWMLWNPRNQYSADGLACEGAHCER